MNCWRIDESGGAAGWGGEDTVRLSNGVTDAAIAAVNQAIGSQLRAVYGDVVRCPLPDRLQALLEKLDNA